MSVKKSVLEQKSNTELEQYIKPDSRFVGTAIKIAFEILKSRGRIFSEEETELINSLIDKKEEKETIVIHENNIKSSNFMFFSAILGVINFSLSGEAMIKAGIKEAIFAIIFVVFIGVLIRRGYNALKYILSVLFVLGLGIFIPYLINDLKNFPINGIISLCQSIVQIYAVVLLFMIPKKIEASTAAIN
jgi:hypothetical protein